MKPLIVFLLLFSNCSFAIVNVESQRLNNTESGTSGNISFTLDGEVAETNDIALGTAITFLQSYSRDEWIILLSREYGEEDKDVYSDETLIHLRHLTKHNPHWGHEVYTQYEEDLFSDLRSRNLFGLGARYTVDANTQLKTANHFGVGLFYEYEKYDQPIIPSSESNTRINVYWTYRNHLTDDMSYTSTLYLQPDITKVSDTKSIWQNAITISITATISLQAKWNMEYDSHSPDGDEENSINYKSILIYNF